MATLREVRMSVAGIEGRRMEQVYAGMLVLGVALPFSRFVP